MPGPTLEQSQDMYETIRLYRCGSKSFDEMCRTSFELIALQYAPEYILWRIRAKPQKLTDDPELRQTVEHYFSEISEALGGHSDDAPRIIQDMYAALIASPAGVSVPPYFSYHPFAREIAKQRLGFCDPDILADGSPSAIINNLREKMLEYDPELRWSPEILQPAIDGFDAILRYTESAGLDKASANVREMMSAITHSAQ